MAVIWVLLTDKSLLAQLLGLGEVLLPLEQSKGLVDQGQDIHAQRLSRLLHLHSSVELLNSLLELLLVEQELTIVVIHIRHLLEVLHAATEGGHGRGDASHLVLSDTELDVRENEVLVEIDGLLVVLGGLGELPKDEVELSTVVVNIRIVRVLAHGLLEVRGGSVSLA